MTKLLKIPFEIRNFLLGIVISIIYLLLNEKQREQYKNLLIRVALPEPTISEKVFSTFSKVILLISFFGILIISSPLFIDRLHPLFITDYKYKFINDNYDLVKQWADYISFVLEITLIFFLSGAIFSETISAKFKIQIENFQNNRNSLLKKSLESIPDELKSSYDNMSKIFSQLNINNFFKDAGNKYKAIVDLSDKTFYGIPKHLKRFMYIKFYSSFPGGLYGLISFILFILLTLANIFSMYLELSIFKNLSN